MSQRQFNPDLNVANAPAASVGRGFGCTIKQLREQVNAYFKRKKIPSHQWRTLAEKQVLGVKIGVRIQEPVSSGRRPDFQSARLHRHETGVRRPFGKRDT